MSRAKKKVVENFTLSIFNLTCGEQICSIKTLNKIPNFIAISIKDLKICYLDHQNKITKFIQHLSQSDYNLSRKNLY